MHAGEDALKALVAEAEDVAFIPFAGTSDDLTRSHFATQDTIELGQSAGGSRDYRSGFMSRLATELTRVKPIAFTDQLPVPAPSAIAVRPAAAEPGARG